MLARTALNRSAVARVLDATGSGSSGDKDSHGGGEEDSNFGEHF